MNTNFRFLNLIGSVYKGGNIVFSADGNTIFSPVGNKVTAFDLKNNSSKTIPIESDLNIRVIAINNSGSHAFLINEGGEAMYINISSQVVLYRLRLYKKVSDAKFSPDGRRIAICRDGDVQIYLVATVCAQVFNPFTLTETFKMTSETVNHLCWSSDSRLLSASCGDKQVRVVAASGKLQNLYIKALASHKGPVIASFFTDKSFNLLSLDQRGLANYWVSKLKDNDLVEGIRVKGDKSVKKLTYNKLKRFNLMEPIKGDCSGVSLSASTFHVDTNLLVVAFSNGVFVLYEIPTFNLIHNLRVSDVKVKSLCINNTSDWIGIGCGEGRQAQLIVWEWQSETYVMKQQSHSETIISAAYSPDGSQIVTGAEDGKVKIWSCQSSFCVVTFTEHANGVSAVCWTPDAKAVLSASLDGTVRAHDLKRYRNFRTLACPEETQLTSMCVDSAGELVVAAAQDAFKIFVWSLENGRLLDILSGHEAPIAAIALSGNTLVSASWDKTVRLWNVVDSSSAESLELLDEALDVAFSPCGRVFAVLCLNSSISLFDANTSTQIGTIETKLDVDPARGRTDVIKKETSGKSKSFTCITFSADGNLLVAAGRSNYVCIYHVKGRLLVKKLQLTTNRSLDGVNADINRRNFSEFGNMHLIDASDSEDENKVKKRIKLAGTLHSDMSERREHPEMRVYKISFSPTGRCFAVCSTEGVAVFSLDHQMLFNPFHLAIDITTDSVKEAIAEEEFAVAVSHSLRLNDFPLIEKALLSTPVGQMAVVVRSLLPEYAMKLAEFLGQHSSDNTRRYVHFWQLWINYVLHEHGRYLKMNRAKCMNSLTAIQQKNSDYDRHVLKPYDQCKYTLQYLMAVRNIQPRKNPDNDD